MSESPNSTPAPLDDATAPVHDETTLADVKQLGIWASIGSLSYVFWIVGGMEMIERLAYYGVRSVASIYATRPVSAHGLGVTMSTFGTLLLWWNLTQCLIPIFTGGLADRYGYKITIGVSTAVKCLAYLLMAWLPGYWGFFVGALCLAVGTAIFKPGVQGTLIRATNRRNSSMAWGIFYQTVNIGGWIGPLIALHMRTIDWKYVFYTNAGFICLNFLLLCTYREPGKEERLARQQRIRDNKEKQKSLFRESLVELKKPHLAVYLLIFTVFFLMFPALFDVLPKYVEDWIDTRPMVNFFFGTTSEPGPIWRFFLGMDTHNRVIQPEGIVNINSGMIMLTCFIFAGLTAKLHATTSMWIGTMFGVVAFVLFGLTRNIGFAVLAMVIYSTGEMLVGPKSTEFLGNIAPADKKAMWIGFSQIPIVVGCTIEGKLGPVLYDLFSSKDRFAREMLVQRGMSPEMVTTDALPNGEAFNKLVQFTGDSPEHLRQLLEQSHHVGLVWWIFAATGTMFVVMIYLYGRWIQKLIQKQAATR